MSKPTRNELLAEYYLRAAGVAALWIDADGNVGAQDVAKIEAEAAQVVYCCPPAVFHLFRNRKPRALFRHLCGANCVTRHSRLLPSALRRRKSNAKSAL
jgi:hypothetical protein